MKKISLVLTVLALTAVLALPAAFAQDQAQPAQAPDPSAQPATPATPAQPPDPSAQPATPATPAPAADQSPAGAAAGSDVMSRTSFTGCLTGTEDNYLLRDDQSGMLFRLHSDKDIDEHVGKKVTVTGKVDDQQREHQAQKEKGSEAAAGAQLPQHGINVEDIKDAGGSCEAQK